MGRTTGQNLTKALVEGLCPREKLYRVPDSKVRGLEIQVTSAGSRSWVLRFRVHGRQKTHTIGRWPEITVEGARKAALTLLADIAGGADPAAKKKAERQSKTVRQLVEQFRKEHLPTLRQNSQTQYNRLLEHRILPALGSKRVKDVDSSDVAALLARIRAETPKGVEANRVRAVISRLYSKGALWGFCPPGMNPALGQVRAEEQKRDRHLSDDELVALGVALRHLEPTAPGRERPPKSLSPEDTYALAAIRLILLTGMRKSEIIGQRGKDKSTGKSYEIIPALRRDAIDLTNRRIRLDQHKTSKRSGARIIPLSSAACQLIQSIPAMVGNPFLIPGANPGESLVGLQKIWERIRSSVPKIQALQNISRKDRADLSDVTIHDLRRSFASVAARMGYPELIISALLGHAAGTVTAGYARLGADPLREHVEAICSRITSLLDGTTDTEKAQNPHSPHQGLTLWRPNGA